jgi:hypothetical protein
VTPEELRAWGERELEARKKDWSVVQERAKHRAKAVGLTDEQAAEAVRIAIAGGLIAEKDQAK